MLKVTSLKHFLRLPWFQSRAEEPDSQARVVSGWSQGMLWYPRYKMRKRAKQHCGEPTQRRCLAPRVPGGVEKEGSDKGGWEQVRGFFSEQGVLERQRG